MKAMVNMTKLNMVKISTTMKTMANIIIFTWHDDIGVIYNVNMATVLNYVEILKYIWMIFSLCKSFM